MLCSAPYISCSIVVTSNECIVENGWLLERSVMSTYKEWYKDTVYLNDTEYPGIEGLLYSARDMKISARNCVKGKREKSFCYKIFVSNRAWLNSSVGRLGDCHNFGYFFNILAKKWLPRWSSGLSHQMKTKGERKRPGINSAPQQFFLLSGATFLDCGIRYTRKVAIEKAKCDVGFRWLSAGAAKHERNAGERCLRHEKWGLSSFQRRSNGGPRMRTYMERKTNL